MSLYYNYNIIDHVKSNEHNLFIITDKTFFLDYINLLQTSEIHHW